MGGAVLATFAGAMVLGWSMGWLGERYRRSRADYITTKNSIPKMRTTMYGNLRKIAGRVVVVAVLFGAAVFGYVSSQQQ
jgi:hypothetical protein